MDDDALINEIGRLLSVPKVAPADSFVLHAPLEFLARGILLPYARGSEGEHARARLRWLAAQYESAGEPVSEPGAPTFNTPEDAATRLVAAIAAGELDDVDRYASWLGTNMASTEVRRLLAAPLVDSLAAAGHASILLYLLPRVASAPATLIRGAARELAREPDWRIRWFKDIDEATAGAGGLTDALLAVPGLGEPGSDFIFPIMNQAEQSGVAQKLLRGVVGGNAAEAQCELSRVAAWSMLQEPPDYAPFGWTHCMTMPQAVMALAGRGLPNRTAVAVASTYVVGFRAALGQRALDPVKDPEDGAAGAVWSLPSGQFSDLFASLATRALLHHDAHLVKYTLACLDAGAADPAHQRLYLAAAASLSEWWAGQPEDGFF